MTKKYICIHGHFYQPPRENAWLEAIELQDSAYPYHDWNARITKECYSANAASRILDPDGRITRIVNNYAGMSFNFGPTLMDWLAENARDVYNAILHADALSIERFSGYGSAMAQPYNHMLMPLANRRDKETQIRWGIRDFEKHFGRHPEGMWLPETAVDHETLDLMAANGILYVLLDQSQALKCRSTDKWRDVSGGDIDPKTPCFQKLPSGGHIAVFFYDGPISRAVGFENLLENGENFMNRLASGFEEEKPKTQLVHIVTDGETFGHHHPHGDMALAYALDAIENSTSLHLTNYREFLEIHPPEREVEIADNTSWSCAHGVKRWHADCGCNSGVNPQWHQKWRQPLRDTLDWLRDTAAPEWEKKMQQYVTDPWNVRNRYIEIIHDRSGDNIETFLETHAGKKLLPGDIITVLKLLEMQRHLMLMYTSCGWFFDEISGIETVQVIQYADRALQLYHQVFKSDLTETFLTRLEKAPSNIPVFQNGRRIYEKFVQPARVTLKDVAAHDVIATVFNESEEDSTAIYCYKTGRSDEKSKQLGNARLDTGIISVSSMVTLENSEFYFAVLYFGEHNLTCGIQADLDDKAYHRMKKEIFQAFEKADFSGASQILNRYMGSALYSLKTLFRDEQRHIMDMILQSALENTLSVYRHVYETHVPLMRFVNSLNAPVPKGFSMAAEIVLNSDLEAAFRTEDLDRPHVHELLEQIRQTGVPLHSKRLEYTLRNTLDNVAEQLAAAHDPTPFVEKLLAGIDLVHTLPFEVTLRRTQNIVYSLMQDICREVDTGTAKDSLDRKGGTGFEQLVEKLGIRFETNTQ